MKLIIAGSRSFNNYKLLKQEVNNFLIENESEFLFNYSNLIIISGTAIGADKLGEQFAKEYECKLELYPADWNKHGMKAGYIRNILMVTLATHCICFWDNESLGTKHMINIANTYSLVTKVITFSKENK